MAPKTTAKKASQSAPKKSAQKPTSKPATKPAPQKAPLKATPQLSAAKAAKPKAANLTVWTPEPEAHAHHHDHSACCGHHHRPSLMANLCACCPIARLLVTRTFWAAAVVAFLVLFATDWLLHTRFLMADYAATSALWRADGEIRQSLVFLTQALTAMVYAAIILGLGHAHRWLGSFTSGVLAAAPVAICALTAYVMMPFAEAYIPTVWAVASLLQGGLAGLAVCASLKASRAPQAGAECCSTHAVH